MASAKKNSQHQRPKPKQNDRPDGLDLVVKFKVIVAIDFGTHGTGLGYAIVPYDENGDSDSKQEPEIYTRQDWCDNTDHKIKTDILLKANGEFIAFGDKALQQYTKMDDDENEYYSSSPSENEENEEKENEQARHKRMEERLRNRKMLFESFKMVLYEKSANDDDGDICEKLKCSDGIRSYPTKRVFVAALKFIKASIFEVFQKKSISLPNGIDDVQWILTVPAIWSDRAKHKMEAWAIRAELINRNIFNHLRIVYEPDCASISCQSESAFKTGERYILIDAGGGTVDIACHQVKGEYSMEEIYHPTGGAWGSDYIDRHFEALLNEIFGEAVIRHFKEAHNAPFTALLDNFRKAKMSFFNKADEEFHRVRINNEFVEAVTKKLPPAIEQMLAEQDIDETDMDYYTHALQKIVENAAPFGLDVGHVKGNDSYLFFSTTVWQQYLFDLVINPMIEHVQKLIVTLENAPDKNGHVAPLQYICIAGGLASSPYFQHRMHNTFGKGSKYSLSIRVPLKPILSVVDGALRLGLKPNYIPTRKVKYTYGIAVDRSVGNVDSTRLPDDWLETHTYLHQNTKKRIVRNLFASFIKKNCSVDLDQAIEKTYRRFHRNEKQAKISIYHSADEDPYYIKDAQKALASVTIEFPPNYHGLSFVVQFFFGDTMIRAKVMYPQSEQQLLIKDLNLEFHDLYQ